MDYTTKSVLLKFDSSPFFFLFRIELFKVEVKNEEEVPVPKVPWQRTFVSDIAAEHK